ncbi:pyridoxamine 5'-phosphate oxidase family protein [Kitasatospora sp. CM 4170]|uniref:Pyridoxamine 5'-phosphate oxidase family protein n=1 Tax=Kitasatospora aburaviensis TaxID=67265 RepID=A0ABW1EUX1_9ACTN|nr:pyridoxamine 5'-phosphate oxidase family protein [Kitasatospora sp. CM 4170]WNM45164.1 pyridoxamine 5'-phosphate oxidase family protein [Kitasatospora sp. CM 4170]
MDTGTRTGTRTEATGREGITEITDAAELRALLGEPSARDAAKERRALHEHDRAFIAAAPLCIMATAGADGTCDASPKGDPAGFTLVLDDRTIAIPERPGNRRADGFHNILANPHIGLIYIVPGRGDTLRVNGRARLVREAPFFDAMTVKGHRPRLAVLVEIEAVFYHCSKAFLRSALWKPETWAPDAAPSRAVISKALERTDEPLEKLVEYYGPNYGGDLYAP